MPEDNETMELTDQDILETVANVKGPELYLKLMTVVADYNCLDLLFAFFMMQDFVGDDEAIQKLPQEYADFLYESAQKSYKAITTLNEAEIE